MPSDVRWHSGIDREERWARLGTRGGTLWFTGLSGAGKSTVGVAVERAWLARGRAAYRLDGDNLRHGLCGDLGFSPQDRAENLRRVAEVARLFADSGALCVVCTISPRRGHRALARSLHEEAGLPFAEVYVATPLSTCRARDPKGLYARAAAGELTGLTGVDAPYEPPEAPEITLAEALSPAAGAERCLGYVDARWG